MDIEKSRALLNEYLERIFVARTRRAPSIGAGYSTRYTTAPRRTIDG